jgi:murein DD-endopeptidase MepM/ murein hydrolase activator NlpD
MIRQHCVRWSLVLLLLAPVLPACVHQSQDGAGFSATSPRQTADALPCKKPSQMNDNANWMLSWQEQIRGTQFEAAVAPVDPSLAPDLWPISHPGREVISRFGSLRARGGRGRRHTGIDIKAPMRTPILATAGGEVVFSGQQRGYGKVVIVDHGNGFKTLYAHLNTASVKKGETVARGQVVGELGRTGRVTTHHLHYEVIREDTPVNPEPYLLNEPSLQ